VLAAALIERFRRTGQYQQTRALGLVVERVTLRT